MYIAQTPYHITHNALKPQKLIKFSRQFQNDWGQCATTDI